MGLGAGLYLAASFAVVQALVGAKEVASAVSFMSVGLLHPNPLIKSERRLL